VVRRWAAWLLRPGVSVPGVSDLTSGVCGVRLVTLKTCFQAAGGALLSTQGRCAYAELVARTAATARQVVAVPLADGRAGGDAGGDGAWSLARDLWRAGRLLRIPPPPAAARRLA
jgi:hypothetical protein